MNTAAALANVLWLGRSRGAARRFARALSEPRGAQEAWLRVQLARHATSEFGRTHDFAGIGDAGAFARRVPLTDYAGVAPSLARIRRGERDLLSCGRVSHLVPTSGSTGARKLIPFTAALQEGFDAAVGPWMTDLARQRPALRWGPAYWSVSPLADDDSASGGVGAVPVGFADDADYLGGTGAWLVRQALAVPGSLRRVRDTSAFWGLTLLALLRQRDLRLMSVWHPSFLDLLVGAAGPHWDVLLEAIERGGVGPWAAALPRAAEPTWSVAPDRVRAAALHRLGPADWPRWWPRLQVVSCWGDQAAASGWRRLVDRLPDVLVQPKGLLATEAVVTIPYRDTMPLAITSHYFEFLDDAGSVRGAHQLERGGKYEVVVSNGGGLWRYRIGDVVECTGHLRATPTLRFLGRAARGSDLRGEKLSEVFVAEVLRSLWPVTSPPAYAALQAWDLASGAGYDLLVSADGIGESPEHLTTRLDAALGANPHYALARRLGQLAAPRIVPVAGDRARDELAARSGRLGDVKPRVLINAGSAER